MLKRIIIALGLGLWPLNLFLNNTFPDFLEYFIALVISGAGFLLFLKGKKVYAVPILILGILNPKLALLPALIFVFDLILEYKPYKFFLLVIAAVLVTVTFKPFAGQTVFNKDYEAEQLILRNIHLYPNVVLARTFQNKGKIYTDKILNNFFVMTDINNYFFALHPRPISLENQNLYKYPFVTIIFFIAGVFAIPKLKNYKKVLLFLVAEIVALSLLKNYDRLDFILFIPISAIMIHGINVLYSEKRKFFNIIACFVLLLSVPEYLRSYVEKIL